MEIILSSVYLLTDPIAVEYEASGALNNFLPNYPPSYSRHMATASPALITLILILGEASPVTGVKFDTEADGVIDEEGDRETGAPMF
jgi:hypothetical protein